MKGSDLDRFVGIPHSSLHDCCDLTVNVARELFNREIALPSVRPRDLGIIASARAVAVAAGELACKILPADVQDGDLVLMRDGGTPIPGHVGTYFFLSHEGWVLHTTHAIGHSSLHRIRELNRLGIQVDGFYRWKT